MPFFFRNTFPQAADVVSLMRRQCAAIGASTFFHIDRGDYGNDVQNSAASFTVSAANGDGTLATLLVLAKALVGQALNHQASVEAHKVADVTFATTVASVVDLASAIVALNAVKTWYNTHRVSTAYHYTADATNTVVTANASDQATSDTLANDLKAKHNAHIASGNIISVPRLTF
jgi:hypothetical protein